MMNDLQEICKNHKDGTDEQCHCQCDHRVVQRTAVARSGGRRACTVQPLSETEMVLEPMPHYRTK